MTAKDTASATATAGKEMLAVNNGDRFTDDQLAEIQGFNDLTALFQSEGVEVENFEDYGTGFELVESKDQLVSKPFAIVEWRFNSGDFGVFVSALIVTEDNRKMILNDGSTGIRRQLESVTARREHKGNPNPQRGLVVRKGLTRSDYITQLPDKDGVLKDTPATTYYLAQ